MSAPPISPIPTYDRFIEPLLSSGAQLVYKNRAGWAHDRLKRAGLSDSPRRGWWQLTEAGRRFVAEHAGPLSAEQAP